MTDYRNRLVVVDTETVCLDPQPGSVWEVAWHILATGESDCWQVTPDLSIADPQSLGMNGFADRYQGPKAASRGHMSAVLHGVWPDGAVLAGSNPTFDRYHLDAMWPDDCPGDRPWHWRCVDVPAMVAGHHGLPDGDDRLSLSWAARTVGLDPAVYDRHSAAGDVALTVAVLDHLEQNRANCCGSEPHLHPTPHLHTAGGGA